MLPFCNAHYSTKNLYAAGTGFMDVFTAGGLGIFITLLGSIVPIIKSRNMKLIEEIKFEY